MRWSSNRRKKLPRPAPCWSNASTRAKSRRASSAGPAGRTRAARWPGDPGIDACCSPARGRRQIAPQPVRDMPQKILALGSAAIIRCRLGTQGYRGRRDRRRPVGLCRRPALQPCPAAISKTARKARCSPQSAGARPIDHRRTIRRAAAVHGPMIDNGAADHLQEQWLELR